MRARADDPGDKPDYGADLTHPPGHVRCQVTADLALVGCAPEARRPNSRQYVAVGAVTSGSAALPGSPSSAAVIGFGA
jgi:hypothetical protein